MYKYMYQIITYPQILNPISLNTIFKDLYAVSNFIWLLSSTMKCCESFWVHFIRCLLASCLVQMKRVHVHLPTPSCPQNALSRLSSDLPRPSCCLLLSCSPKQQNGSFHGHLWESLAYCNTNINCLCRSEFRSPFCVHKQLLNYLW